MRTMFTTMIVARVLLVAAPVTARVFDEGLKAYEGRDFATALAVWEPLAAARDIDAVGYREDHQTPPPRERACHGLKTALERRAEMAEA